MTTNDTTDPRNPALATMSLAERLEQIRQARGYIQKKKIESVGHKAVTHDYLLELVRPLFIQWGVRWKPVSCDLLSHDVIQLDGGKVIFTELLRWTFRFKCTEDPDYDLIDVASSAFKHEDVIVVGRGLGRQAKDAGGAQTYAEKYALFSIMNLGRGDDPDLTPVDLSPDVPAEIEALVQKIRGILDADDTVVDTDARLRDIAAGWAEKYGRKVRSIYSLGVSDLERTIAQLTKKPDVTKKTKALVDEPAVKGEEPPF